jgi:transposase
MFIGDNILTNAEINKARRLNRIYEQVEKDEMIQKLISAHGEALFQIAELKRELDSLKAIYEFKRGTKP